MSAIKILVDRLSALSQFSSKAFFFNLNYLPDTILGGIILFSLMIQSLPLGVLGIVMFSLELFHASSTGFFTSVISGVLQASDEVQRCSGHYPGISYERLVSVIIATGSTSTMNSGFPSYYIMFFAALFAYITGVSHTYHRELQGMPQRKAAVYTGLYIMGLLFTLFVTHRYVSGCDSHFSAIIATFLGLFYGYALESIVAWLSDRRLTNLVNIPLISNRAEDGKPIYVCKKQAVPQKHRS